MVRTTNGRIIKVTLFEPYKGQREWYFGSLKAIFEDLPEEVVGTTLYYIYHYADFISSNRPFVTDSATISYVNVSRMKRRKKGA